MKFCFPLVLCIILYYSSAAQPSDILLLKKNNHTIKTFFPGNQIIFNTSAGYYSGLIQSIRKDSLFLVQYDIRRIPNSLGFYFLDTVGTYPFSIHYKQITSFGKNQNNFDWSASGGALFGGGVLLTTVGLGTWLLTKPKSQYYASPYLIGGAAFLAIIGYLLIKSGSKGLIIGKKYSLEYIQVK